MSEDVNEMSDEEIIDRIVSLGFGGDREKFKRFIEILRGGLPEGTGVALRGSVVTGERWKDGEPFDAEGPCTSDFDVTLIGSKVMEFWDSDAYYIPALHTKPLGDKDPGIAPALNPLRKRLQELTGRPVNFQATSNLILFGRDMLLGQPYFNIVEPAEQN